MPYGHWLWVRRSCSPEHESQGRGEGPHIGFAAVEGGADNALVGSAPQSGAQGRDFLQHPRTVSSSASYTNLL